MMPIVCLGRVVQTIYLAVLIKITARYPASTGLDLDVNRNGIIWQKKLGNLQAHNLRDGTMACLRIFSTELHGAPNRRKNAPKTSFDNRLFEHLTKTIECFVSDAAADEQLAGELLRAPSQIPTVCENFSHLTNLLVVGRDRAHAARCTERCTS